MSTAGIPSPTLTETWQVTKPAVESAGGLVARQHHLASEVGAQVLADYACPNVVARDTNVGRSQGGAYIMSPWARVVAQ